MQVNGPRKSLKLKILIGISQLFVILPGAFFGYLIASQIESKVQFEEGTDPKKMLMGLIFFALASIPFGLIWYFFMKKTGLSETDEFRFMMGRSKDD